MTNKKPDKKITARGLPAQAGFTLMETLVAILLLSMAIAGPLTIASKGIQATTIAKDEDSAFYLAQDAVEYVRFVRDTNKLQGSADWLAGLDGTGTGGIWKPDGSNGDCVSSGGTAACTVDSLQNSGDQYYIQSCPSGVCPAINYDSTNLIYSYTSGVATPFVRTVSITNPVGGNANEAAITVTVSWKDPLSHSVTVRENIFNWQ